MRIAIIVDSLQTGGRERQAVPTAAELHGRGHHVELITYHQGNDFVEFIRDRGIPATRVQAGGFLRMGRGCAMVKHLRDGRFDIAHCFRAYATITGSLAAGLAGVTPVGAARTPYAEQGLVPYLHRTADRLIAAWIVNSRGIAESLSQVLGIRPEKCAVVYNGIDTDLFTSRLTRVEAKQRVGVHPTHQVVSIIARLRPEKNHTLFLQAASLMLTDRPDTRFVVVGDGECRSALEESARSMGIAERVLFLGSRSDVADLPAATDVSVLTSVYEGLPNTLIESMCMGVPIVTTDYAVVQEVVTDGREGFVVRRGDAQAMAARVGQLVDDPQLRQAMGECGQQTVNTRFSIHTMAEELEAVYRQCLERTGKPVH